MDLNLHFGKYTMAQKELILIHDGEDAGRVTGGRMGGNDTPQRVDTVDLSSGTNNYSDLLSELKGLIPDINNPSTIEEKVIIASYLDKILQCGDLPDAEGCKYIDMAKNLKGQIDSHVAKNGVKESSIKDDSQLKEKTAELAQLQSDREKLQAEIDELPKRIGKDGYTYDQFMKDINVKGPQMGKLMADIQRATADIANYMLAHGGPGLKDDLPQIEPDGGGATPVNGGTEVGNVITDIDGNKIGETVYEKDADGNITSETVYKYDSSGNKISETSVTRDVKGNIINEIVVNYKNNNPSGYAVNDYEYDENGRVAKETTKNLNTDHAVTGSQTREHVYDENGAEIGTTYTSYDRSGNPTSSLKDENETYTKEDGSVDTRLKSRTSATYDKGELTGTTKTNHGYDEAGNVTSDETTYFDKEGKEISGTVVTYDAEGKVTGRKTISYIRNEEGNITLKRTVDAIDPNSGAATHEIIEVFDKDGNKVGSDDVTTIVDEHGNKVSDSVIRYNAGGVKESEFENEFDANGRNTHTTTVNFDEAGNKTGSTEMKNVFSEDGQLDSQEVIDYDADGQVTYTTNLKREYDENGRILSGNFSITNKDGVEIQSAKDTYEYNSITGELINRESSATRKDDNGNILEVRKVRSDAEDNIRYEESFTYNENGIISSGDIVYHNEDGSINGISHYEVGFDENGVEVSRTTDDFDANGTKIKSTINSIQRDESGNVVSRTETVVEYDENGEPVKEKTIVKDLDDNVLDEINSVYDENGEKSETHIETEVKIYQVTTDNGTKINRKREIATERDANGNVLSRTTSEIDMKTGEVLSSSKDEFKNGVKVRNTSYVAENGEANGKNLSSTTVTNYDEYGLPASVSTENRYKDTGKLANSDYIEYYADGTTKTREINVYDDNEQIKTHTLKTVDEKGNDKTVLDQYENGVKTKSTSTTKVNKQKVDQEVTTYGQDGKPVSKEHIDYKDGNKVGTTTEVYTYTDNGVTAVRTVKDNTGKVVSQETIYLDANFNVISGTAQADGTAKSDGTSETGGASKTDEASKSDGTPTLEEHKTGLSLSDPNNKLETKTETRNDGTTVKTTTETNPNGRPVAEEKVFYDASGKISYIETKEYNKENGNLAQKTTEFPTAGKEYGKEVSSVVTVTYDENGKRISETSVSNFKDTGATLRSSTTEYAEDGSKKSVKTDSYSYYTGKIMQTVTETYNTSGKVTEKKEESYDDKGNVYQTSVTNNSYKNGKLRSATSTTYDKAGKITKEKSTYYDKDGKEIKTSPTTDVTQSNGFTIEVEVSYRYNSFGEQEKIETTTKKDANGQKVAEKIACYSPNGKLSTVTVNEYKGNTLMKSTIVNHSASDQGKLYTSVRIFNEQGQYLYASNETKDTKTGEVTEYSTKEYYDDGKLKNSYELAKGQSTRHYYGKDGKTERS